MYRVLIADDDYEDRELLKREIAAAVPEAPEFHEAQSVARARELLETNNFDLLTLDIEFDRLDEGIDALPYFFEHYPTLNIIVVSGKLNKAEVTERLFRFTRDNVLKGKRWVRHFDVLDKKDDKAGALKNAYDLAASQSGSAEKVRELFAIAEGHLARDEYDKCLDVYAKIQELAPGEIESGENIPIIKGEGFARALEYMKGGDRLVAALLLGHHIERRLKLYTQGAVGRTCHALYDCLRELDRTNRLSPYKRMAFQKLLKLRNKAVHSPSTLSVSDFENVERDISVLEAGE